MRVLVVEDEQRMAELLKAGLEEENHTVTVAHDGETGFDLATTYEFDVILLDVLLPRLDGFGVAKRLREQGNQTPILMLTARDAVPDVVKGLDLGADDYLTKPFAFDELLARLRSTARHVAILRSSSLQIADLALDPATHEVTRNGRQIKLSATEFRLLEFLMRRSRKVVPRTAIVEGVWGFDREIEENTLDAFIKLLRNKVDRDYERKLIQTVRGVGYSISESENEL
jgi:DNA-binding response OmpR family regulator